MSDGLIRISPSVNSAALENRSRNSSLALAKVNELLEAQSKRIAHAVHDEAGQLLAAIFIRLDQASQELPPTCGSCFEEIKRMLELVELQLREISHDLRPAALDDLGLVPAFQGLIQRVSKRSGIHVNLTCALPDRLDPQIEITLYRIMQESLTNVVKHARARNVEVGLAVEGDCVHASIGDDGVGFDLNEVLSRRGERGLGLLGIKERVESQSGALFINSCPGKGTQLVIKLPIRGNDGH